MGAVGICIAHFFAPVDLREYRRNNFEIIADRASSDLQCRLEARNWRLRPAKQIRCPSVHARSSLVMASNLASSMARGAFKMTRISAHTSRKESHSASVQCATLLKYSHSLFPRLLCVLQSSLSTWWDLSTWLHDRFGRC